MNFGIHPQDQPTFRRSSTSAFALTKTPHLQSNAYHVPTKNLSDLAAVSKTALEHTVALL